MKLCQAEFAHNHAYNRSLWFSPLRVVYSLQPRCPLDLTTLPDKSHFRGQAIDFVDDLQRLHNQARENLESSSATYKAAADAKRRALEFKPGDLVWIVLTKDRFPICEYNKFKSRKIGPVQVVERINENAYRVLLPPHMRTPDVFNVKYLSPYLGDNEDLDSWANLSPPGGI